MCHENKLSFHKRKYIHSRISIYNNTKNLKLSFACENLMHRNKTVDLNQHRYSNMLNYDVCQLIVWIVWNTNNSNSYIIYQSNTELFLRV